ncbi:transposase [Aeromonas media]|uniref:Transposase n=1 Tax=Aeromonas media TaxID=651 RepID=A0A6M4YCN4_AERME|nr:transposase [Aeromonas media]QJT22740.1 transposase [Aeromonas media]QYK83115.1 transposase [Aeromonas media]
MTIARSRQISLQDTPYYHVVSRCVRRAFLCGEDAHSGQSYEHRRQWVVDKLGQLSRLFAIGICAYAVMNNHYHLVLKVEPDTAASWSEREVAERWAALFQWPLLVRRWYQGESLIEPERTVVQQLIGQWRERLHSISWFVRLLNENLARQANREDSCKGHFWEGRFKSQALLTESALLACMAYVDLNPIRAALADRPEESNYTSIKQRFEGEQPDAPLPPLLLPFASQAQPEGLPYAFTDYLMLVDWTGRAIRADKRGYIPAHLAPILARLGLDGARWLKQVTLFRRQGIRVVGDKDHCQQFAWHCGQRRCHQPPC